MFVIFNKKILISPVKCAINNYKYSSFLIWSLTFYKFISEINHIISGTKIHPSCLSYRLKSIHYISKC